jgi:hypothetical protein
MQNLFLWPNHLSIQCLPVAFSRGVKLLLRLELIAALPALTDTTYDVHINKYIFILLFSLS